MTKRFVWALALLFWLGLSGPVGATTCSYPIYTHGDNAASSLSLLTDLCNTAGGGSSLTDSSVSSATGSSQTLVSADTVRRVLNITNVATHSWWIKETGGTASANCAGCFELTPGSRWTPRPAPTNAVTGIGTATDKLTIVTGP